MIHARPDYNRIQDPEHKIPEDEPVFLLRAQDAIAPSVVEIWSVAAHKAGASPEIVNAAYIQAHNMREWQKKHGSKIPDLPGGPDKKSPCHTTVHK
jgi:hypothetical protein